MSEILSGYTVNQAKLYRPRVVADYLHRQQLLDRFEEHNKKPLTLVSAPAGYGKSMLVSHWLKTCNVPCGWISLDENDNDLRMFAVYFIAAIEGVLPGICRKSQIMINSQELPKVEDLASALRNELEQLEQPFIMVLDDYHLVNETMVHDLLTELLKHSSRFFHLVIICRHDPPLPIYKLRAKNLVTEIRTNDLRFNESETIELLKLVTGKQIDLHIAATLAEKTEGWVTGLCLAAISLRLTGYTELLSLKQHADTQLIAEYFFNEILAKQPSQITQYLLFSSILNRFCASLCEVVCDQEAEVLSCEHSGWEYIAWLKKENMFLIPLDIENHWFRFHHLFRNLLLNQLKRHYSTEDINVLHARASAWFADNGMIEEAIRHNLAAGDVSGAVQLVIQNRQAAVNTERWFELKKWLSLLPDDIVQQHLELLLAQVWIHIYHYNYGLIPANLDRIEYLFKSQPHLQSASGEISLFKGIAFFFQGDCARSLKYLEDAKGQISEAQHFLRAGVEQFWGMAGHMQGQKERVIDELTDLLQNQSLKNVRKIRVMASLVTVHMLSGDLTVAFSLSQQLKNFAISINSNYYIASSSYILGRIHFCRNEMDKAIGHLSQAAELGHIVIRRLYIDCLGGLALAYQAKGHADNATASMKRLDKLVQSLKNSDFLDIAHSFEARLSLMKGKVPSTQGLFSRNWRSRTYNMFFWLESPDITQCRVFIAAGSERDLQEAENMLKEILRLSQAQHNTFQTIFILPLLASAYEKQGRTEEALTVLEEAVALAAPGAFIRPFVEAGPATAGLLKLLAEKNIAVDFIGHIMEAFSSLTDDMSPIDITLEGQLTNREYDILTLLAERLQTKEISEKLFISTHTVNTHLKSLYRKLNVNNRRQAVARAKNLKIL